MSAFFDKIIDELQLFNYISKYLTPILVLNIVNFYQIKKKYYPYENQQLFIMHWL